MITEIQQLKIYLLSDTVLYQQAVTFMESFLNSTPNHTLPSTQMYGLLNATYDKTYTELEKFVNHQHSERTWTRGKEYVGEFYKKLHLQLQVVTQYTQELIEINASSTSTLEEDQVELKALLAREFIQHVVAENAHIEAQQKADKEEQQRQQTRDRR